MTSRKMVTLEQITPADEPRVGGKAYNCARLKQAGFRVPDGVVVTSTATDADLAALADHPWFGGIAADARFAVRSSGIGEDSGGQSFAGIHQTLLDVGRGGVVDAVRQCQRSARSAQAIEYRRAQGLSTETIEIAVLIQPMVDPVAAGVAFTINPVTGASRELVINASWGVGEALVSGQVDPDEFVVRKPDGELLWSRIGAKAGDEPSTRPALTPQQVEELAGILVAIERLYGTPQDVEWCHDGADFWIVQSRPVTASPPVSKGTQWTRANLAEVLPDMTSPQALAALEDLLARAERQAMGGLMAPESELGPMVKSFHGRMYFNLSQLRHVCAVGGIAPATMLKSMGHAGAIDPSDERAETVSVGERLSRAPFLLRTLWRHLRVASIIRSHEASIASYLERFAAIRPETLSDAQVWANIEESFDGAGDSMQTVLLLSGVLIHEVPVQKLCEKVGYSYERLVFPQLATGKRSVSAQQAFDLISLADSASRDPAVVEYLKRDGVDLAAMRVALRGSAFLADFERFLQNYGHRGRYESDWSLPRYNEDPTPLLRAIRAHLEDPTARNPEEFSRKQETDAAQAWSAFEARLSGWQRLTMLARVRRSIATIKQYYLWREQVRSDLVRVLAVSRTWHLVLAGRFVERGLLKNRDEYFLLRFDEVARAVRGQLAPEGVAGIVASRTAEMARHRSMQMPLLMRESELAQLIRTAGVSSRSGDERQLTGHPVSPGCVEAEVVVVLDPADFGRMKRGAILVAPATDPSWTPLFTLASGVIVEVGGVLSHASTVAREYGLPALANVKHATKRLRTGERVRLDASNGIVVRLEDAAAGEAENLAAVV